MTQETNVSNLRVAVLYVSLSTFTQRDIAALCLRYKVTAVNCGSARGIISSVWGVIRADCIFCWFGSLRFLPAVLVARVFAKKVIIVSGGYDVAKVPEIGYGTMYGKIKRHLGRILFMMAHIVTCVSHSNGVETIKNAKVSPNKVRMIYHGFYDTPDKAKMSLVKKEKMVVTVGKIDMCTIYRKGLLTTAKLAQFLPDVPFLFAGTAEQQALHLLKEASGKNVEFMGYLKESGLADLLMRAKVYLQPSLHEAFGCSVAEAMLYNCIPVVSNRYALPEVVGEAGISIDPDNLGEMAGALRQILNGGFQVVESPRERVLRKFPMSKRTQLLIEMVDELCGLSQTRDRT